ncbi:hypothetical protein ZOSMA_209G00330 [Zostera marina]|uniref:Uncharacterized protein n=1 Tax=Zostera marina TaxID=29655 RepID=A0A0K9PKX2_ZOSMR|nr:hypothetical protein ZOSMA_209G00330 [Zostera marina]
MFHISGPKFLGTPRSIIDWHNEEHRRIVMACLVQAVYVRWKDLKSKNKPQLAHPWYESFHFKHHLDLMHSSKVYGVVFKFDSSKAQISHTHRSIEVAPTYVVSLRGTKNAHDLWHDMRFVFERLSCTRKCATKILGRFMKEGDEDGNNFKNIHQWIPSLFVNPKDFICNGFIGYFNNKKHFKILKPGILLTSGKRHLYRIPWKIDRYSTNLLPSAHLVKNNSIHIKSAHALSQWWRDDLELTAMNTYISNTG